MKTIYAFFRQLTKTKDYYIGTALWAVGVLLSEIGKAKKDLVYDGMLSEDSKEPLVYGLAALLFMGLAFVVSLKIVHQHRKFFTHYHPNAKDFGLSFTWAMLKHLIVILITLIPGVIYVVANLQMIMIDPAQSVRIIGIAMAMQFIFLPLWLIVGFGALSLAITRGTAYRTTRDSFAAFRQVWKESLMGCVLLLLPAVILVPFRVLGLGFSSLQNVAIVISVFMAPYSFGVMNSLFLYLGKLLSERAPALVAAKEETT